MACAFVFAVNAAELPLQCHETVDWVTGRASGL